MCQVRDGCLHFSSRLGWRDEDEIIAGAGVRDLDAIWILLSSLSHGRAEAVRIR
jgi:hypothetical protein